MKNQILLFLSLFFLMPLLAQNTPPQVSIQNVNVDVVMQQVTVTYNLADAQQDDCEVWLKVSLDGGAFYSAVEASDLSGDVGPDIVPGKTYWAVRPALRTKQLPSSSTGITTGWPIRPVPTIMARP